jgi:hypothetical protein
VGSDIVLRFSSWDEHEDGEDPEGVQTLIPLTSTSTCPAAYGERNPRLKKAMIVKVHALSEICRRATVILLTKPTWAWQMHWVAVLMKSMME